MTFILVQLEPKFIETETITIKAAFNEFPISRMPSSIGYIKNLDELNLQSISFVENLNQIPGINAASGTLNTNRITIRGVGSRTPYGTNRIKAYYGNIPLTTGDGTTEIEDINASDIGNIEVFKGSKSALYGSGLGGVLALNPPKSEKWKPWQLRQEHGFFQLIYFRCSICLSERAFLFQGWLESLPN